MVTLRQYQQDSVDAIRQAYRDGKRAPLLVSPTGSGKTVTFSYVATSSAAKGNRTIICCHRAEIMRQIEKSLRSFGHEPGVISAGRHIRGNDPVVVASVQTLVRRLDAVAPPDLLVIDEAHHSVSSTYRKVIERYKTARLLGVTATPLRLDGRGLGEQFDRIIEGPSVQTLIDQGYLAKPIYYAPPSDVDPSQLHIVAGDFNRSESEAMMDKPKITGDCISHYTRICAGRSAVAFCTSIQHAEHVTEQFNAVGYKAAMIDGKLDDRTRADRVSALADGRINVLVSVDLISEGFDLPAVTAAILLRPTASLALCLQQIGRVLRPAPGKANAFVIDHVGNVLRHGFAEDAREWSLDPAKRRAKKESDGAFKNRQCPKCYAVTAWAPKCPQCGHVYEVKPREIKQVDGTLVELTPEAIANRRAHQKVGMAKDRAALTAIARQRNYKPGWVTMMLAARAKNGVKTFAPAPAAPAPELDFTK